MGTRHLTMVQMDRKYVVAQYGQWDGYPGGAGAEILDFLRRVSLAEFRQKLGNVYFVDESEIDFLYEKGLPQMSRDTGPDILRLIMLNCEPMPLCDSSTFAGASLFCEWAYVVNLDDSVLEVYEGFNKADLSPDERFYDTPCEENGFGYKQVRFAQSWPLDALPETDDFVRVLEGSRNE